MPAGQIKVWVLSFFHCSLLEGAQLRSQCLIPKTSHEPSAPPLPFYKQKVNVCEKYDCNLSIKVPANTEVGIQQYRFGVLRGYVHSIAKDSMNDNIAPSRKTIQFHIGAMSSTQIPGASHKN